MKFLDTIKLYETKNLLNEQDPAAMPPADPAAAPPAEDPAAAAPPPPPPEAAPDQASEAIVDVDLARRLALQLSDISSADRAALTSKVSGENIGFIRDTLNSIAAIYDSPDQ